jgi:hypothetical protein
MKLTIMEGERERIRSSDVVTDSMFPWHFLEGTEESHETPQSRYPTSF